MVSRAGHSLERMWTAAKEDPLSGPERAMMGALGGQRQDKGSRAWAWIWSH